MLKKIEKSKGSNISEARLIKLANETFLDLWAYPNVYSDEGINKQKIGKEVCDLLVVFNNYVIIFSDKSSIFNNEIDIKIAWPRWFRNSVIDSCKQLYGAEKFIKSFPERLYLDKECKIPFPVKFNSEMRFFLIATTDNTSLSAMKYYDKFATGSSGSLINHFFINAKENINKPFTIGDLYPDKNFIHVFDEENISLIFNHVNTITDFITYLEEKERAIRCHGLAGSGGEESTLALYLMNNKSLIDEEIRNDDHRFFIHEFMWDEYIKSPVADLNRALLKGSIFWDQLIKRFAICILDANVGLGQNNDFNSHEMIIRELASESRASRYHLSKNFIEKIKQVPTDQRSARIIQSTDSQGKFFLFLFLPRTSNQSYDEYRTERVEYIQLYSLVAHYKYDRIKKLIIIATEPKLSESRSEDIMVFEFNEKLNKDQRKTAQRIIKEEKILSDFLNNNYDRPSFLSPTDTINKVGRNELCPCGSGLKFKKCHL